jgi:hypothetical protein
LLRWKKEKIFFGVIVMTKEELMLKYESALKDLMMDLIKRCWDSDGDPVDVGEQFPLDLIQTKKIGETVEEQEMLGECLLLLLSEDEYIAYDPENKAIYLFDFIG